MKRRSTPKPNFCTGLSLCFVGGTKVLKTNKKIFGGTYGSARGDADDVTSARVHRYVNDVSAVPFPYMLYTFGTLRALWGL